MLKWIPNSDNTDFELEKDGDHIHVTNKASIWRIQVWINDHVKVDAHCGKVENTPLEDVQALAEALHKTYRGWMR